MRHRPDEGVDSRTHILEVDHQALEIREHFTRRLARFAVQAVDGNVQNRMQRVRRFDHVCLLFTPETVLG